MRILPEPVIFEWDKGNIDKSRIKHRVRNLEAEEVFFEAQSVIFEDPKHSGAEQRYLMWGHTKQGRKLAVIFTLRGKRVRIISARDMHRKEKKVYEEIKKNPQI